MTRIPTPRPGDMDLGEQLLPEIYDTKEAVQATASALSHPCYIQWTSTISQPQKGQPDQPASHTYQIVLCTAEKQQQVADRVLHAYRLYWEPVVNHPQTPLDLLFLLATWLKMASPWPKPLTPEERQQ